MAEDNHDEESRNFELEDPGVLARGDRGQHRFSIFRFGSSSSGRPRQLGGRDQGQMREGTMLELLFGVALGWFFGFFAICCLVMRRN
mmetsp:Transcript_9719/g.16371  ORF Transcript_9719/g.16371 Transcript_9719/m.16371 type:complete len:87 (+) Transcript_9719:807-1067(+)